MKLHEGIKKAVELRSESIVFDYQFTNILSDLQAFAEFPSGRTIIKKICSIKYINDLFDLNKKNEILSEQNIFNEIDRIAYVMSGDCNEELDLVRYCFESIAYGLSLINNIDGYYTVDNFKHAFFIGHWDFLYEEKKMVRLYIGRNRKAITSNNIELDWNPISDTEIELLIPGIISFRGEKTHNKIVGTARKEFSEEEWSWQAIKNFLSEESLIYSEWIIKNENSEVEDFVFQFLPKGYINSDTHGAGRWFLDGKELRLSMFNGFVSYIAFSPTGDYFISKGKNKMGDKWGARIFKYK